MLRSTCRIVHDSILAEDKERAADSMPPPPARKEIVLVLRAPSAVPVAQPKSRKRKFTKGAKSGSETSCLAGELSELEGRWSETEAMLTAVKDSHSAKVSKLVVAIGELERDLAKTASSLLKEKKARKAKSSRENGGDMAPGLDEATGEEGA
ncbi:hypothetical protein Bca52824_053672 [Brassica carinata]|uniref:Uncharacterized protein n=1 Tax=Brassica carinata TaxID=52824 RepID=A0A8X7UKU9_BRACI|nr:hypothetical protein Bca52824_053672 [Brassica carinata]